MQSGPSRLVKDEYSAGVVGGPSSGQMDIDGDVHGVSQTIQHHPPPAPPPSHQQFSLVALQTQPPGKLNNFFSLTVLCIVCKSLINVYLDCTLTQERVL